MQKDFMAVAPADAGVSEAAFVEQHWTRIWQGMGGPGRAPGDLSGKPEYRMLARYLEGLPRGARILDGGCGLGEWTATLAQAGFDVTGLDISRETVAALRRALPQARFEAGDIRATGFPDNHFDLYFSWGVFEHFEDGLQSCIREALRVLKPGAPLLISVPFDSLRVQWIRRRRPRQPGAGERFYQWRLTAEEVSAELATAGFGEIVTRPIHVRQGVLRSLQHHLGIPHKNVMARAMSAVLAPMAPPSVFAHMIVAAARKPRGA